MSLHTYTYDGQWSEGTECVLCLEAFQKGEKLRVLPCRHEFHQECIDRSAPRERRRSGRRREAKPQSAPHGGRATGDARHLADAIYAHPPTRSIAPDDGRWLLGPMQQFRCRSCPMCKADPLRQPPAPTVAAMAMSEATAIEMSRRSSEGAGGQAADGQAADGQGEARRSCEQSDPWLGSPPSEGATSGDRWLGLGSGDAAGGDPWIGSSAAAHGAVGAPATSLIDGRRTATSFANLQVVDVGSSGAPSEQNIAVGES